MFGEERRTTSMTDEAPRIPLVALGNHVQTTNQSLSAATNMCSDFTLKYKNTLLYDVIDHTVTSLQVKSGVDLRTA